MKQQLSGVVCTCICLFASTGTLSAQPTSQLVERVNLAEFMERAQTQDTTSVRAALTIGSRVRIMSTAGQRPVKGTVEALDEIAVTLATDGGLTATIPLTSITTLERSLGRKRNWLKGAAIGGVVGLIAGLTSEVDANYCSLSAAEKAAEIAAEIAAYNAISHLGGFGKSHPRHPGYDPLCSRGEAVGVFLISSAIVGAGIGALIKTERWRAVTLSVAGPLTRPGQQTFGVNVRF